MERETTSEVGDTQCDGEWWSGSNSKEDGSSLLLFVLFLSVVFMWFIYFWNLCDCYNILFIFETYVIVTLYNFVVILDYLVLLLYLQPWICKLLTYVGLIFTNCDTIIVGVILICKWYGWSIVMIDLIYELVYYLLMIYII